MGEIVADKRYCASGGSDEDLRSVCSCTCLTCHPSFLSRARSKRRRSSYNISPPPVYSDFYQSPPRSRPGSIHDIRSHEFDDLSLMATICKTSIDGFHNQHFNTNATKTKATSVASQSKFKIQMRFVKLVLYPEVSQKLNF